MINATQLSAFKLALLDIAIKVGVFAALLVLNFITSALTNGSVQLPYTPITLPALTLVISQLDSYFVDYAKKENVPVPTA